MNKQLSYFVALLALLTLACSTSTAPAAVSASVETSANPESVVKYVQNARSAQSRVPVLGRVYVRSCASTACTPLGFVDAGGQVSTTGKVIETHHPDCQQWQPVSWRGKIGYVCAAWLAMEAK